MSKLGTQFELVVSDVLRELDPGATVRQGEWIEGPDGRRDLDVIIEGAVGGVVRRIQIECKDYNPVRGPIGIGLIDALESKHRDLKMDVSLLCSNAGFSGPAIRKAKRSNIGLIGVLRKNDPRIRYRIFDSFFVRRVDFVLGSARYTFDFIDRPILPADLEGAEICFEGIPVENWLTSRALIFLSSNPIVNGIHKLSFSFKYPVQFAFRNQTAFASRIHVEFEITGGWFEQELEIDGDSGLYDWMRKTVRRGPHPGSIEYKGLKVGVGGTPVECPPDFEKVMARKVEPGELALWILDLGGIKMPAKIPMLDRFVVDEDLRAIRSNLPRESYYSK